MQDHLKLQLIRVRDLEQWTPNGEGLAFLLPKEGGGKYISRRVAERLTPGDVLILNDGGTGKVRASNGGDIVFSVFSLCLEHLFPLFASDEIPLLKQVIESLKGVRLFPSSSPVAAKCHRLIKEVPSQFNLDHRVNLVRIAAAVLAEEFETAKNDDVNLV